MFDHLKKKLLTWISSTLIQQNYIDTQSPIERESYISGSEIIGNVSIGKGCKIYRSFIQGEVSIGKYSSVWGPGSAIISHVNSIRIGNFCSIAKNVIIQESNHKSLTIASYNILRNVFNEDVKMDMESKGQINIGHDVWIGANAVVLSGCKIGHGAIVASGAIVTKDVPNYAVVAGNPGSVIKYRFSEEEIETLLELKWWNWSLDKIKSNRQLFEQNFSKSLLTNIV